MRVPERITIKLINGPDEDLSGIIVGLVVSTGKRNPRSIYFPKTNTAGHAKIDRAEFLGQFRDATEADLMGSWGNIDDASSCVEVVLYDPSHATVAGKSDWSLLPHEMTKWPSRAAEYAYRTSCRNTQFTASALTVDLHECAEIELQVMRSGPTAASPA